jgi:Flp pilus assembly protein TadB
VERDFEREMEELSREAKQRLAAEKESEARERAPSPVEKGVEEIAEGAGAGAGFGTKVLAVLGALVVLSVLWSQIVGPLVRIGVTVAVVAALAWFVWKVLGGGKD